MRKRGTAHHLHFNFQSKCYSIPWYRKNIFCKLSAELPDQEEFQFQLSPEDTVNQHTAKKKNFPSCLCLIVLVKFSKSRSLKGQNNRRHNVS